MPTAALVDPNDPSLHLVLQLVRLQIFTPLGTLLGLAVLVICTSFAQPTLREVSGMFETPLTPSVNTIGALGALVFALQVLFCVILVFVQRHETKEMIVKAVGFKLVLSNVLLALWAITFTTRFFLISTIFLSISLLALITLQISLHSYPPTSSRPLDALTLHAPSRLLLPLTVALLLPSAVISAGWAHNAGHPEEFDKKALGCTLILAGVHLVGLSWVAIKHDVVIVAGAVWSLVAVLVRSPKPAGILAVSIAGIVLYPIVFVAVVLWDWLRKRSEERAKGRIALPPDEEGGVASPTSSSAPPANTEPSPSPWD